MTGDEARTRALLEERRGYLVRGLRARADQVDRALAALGYKADDAPVEQATAVPGELRDSPRGRRSRSQADPVVDEP